MKRIEYKIVFGVAYAIIKRRKGASLTDECPFCSYFHMHGPEEGYREKQCLKRIRINAPDGTVLDNHNGYLLKEYE